MSHKRTLTAVLLAAAILGIPLPPAIAAAPAAKAAPTALALKDVSVADPSLWRAETTAGDTVKLNAVDGCLKIEFDLDVKGFHQVGNNSFNQATARVLLRKPITLDGDAGRILYESLGSQLKGWNARGDQTRLMPLLRDASGEYLAYAPARYPHLHGGDDAHWERWMTPYFYCGEAGAATQDIYEAEGGDGNAWPDGTLTFVGFVLETRRAEFGRKQGTVAIGSVQISGLTLPYEEPYAYADSLIKDKGDYKLAGQVSNNFQALPVREIARTLTYDPANLQSQRQRVSFPLGPDDNYWIRYQINATDGSVVAGETLRAQATSSPSTEPLKVVDAKTPPSIGYLRINPDSHTSGTYKRDEPFNVNVRVFPKGISALTVNWKLTQYKYPAPIEQGTQQVTFAGKPFTDLLLPLKGEAGRDAYCLRLTVNDGAKVIDQADYYVGRETDFSKPYTARTGVIADRDSVKDSSYYRISYIVDGPTKFNSEDDALTHFTSTMNQISRMSRYVTYMLDLADFEVLPGVYDFKFLDRVMDAAADRGCALTVRLGHADQMGEYKWLKYSRQHNFDGLEIFEHYYGGFAVTDENYTGAWLRAYRAIYDRYKVHPGFQGYYLLQPAGEATVEDKPWEGIVSGYDMPTREAFRKYLRDDQGFTLDDLNKRWASKYTAWDQVMPPMADFRRGVAPDLRMTWVDFCRFKAKLDKDWWFPLAAKAIREYDKNHVIIVYGGTYAPEHLTGLVDYFHNGGNHFLQGEETLIDSWTDGKTGWITEPHHPHRWAAYGDPAAMGWVLDWSVYVMTAQAGGGGANMHVYYMPTPRELPAHYGGFFAYDRFLRYKPILDELQTMALVRRPAQIGALHDPYTMYTKHRTAFAPRLEDLKRWFELLKGDGLRYEPIEEKHLDNYKLLLPNIIDEEMSDHNIAMLDKQVRERGAKMVIAANTGSYCPERGAAPFQFLKQLGITPPTGPYVQNEAGVAATQTGASPLFAASEKLAFFTRADLQRDLQSEEVRKSFWAWPYRWIPQTDYFGYYRDNKTTNGDVLSRFPSGAVAVSLHKVGKGEVLVFWGCPDFRQSRMKGFMTRVAAWAGVTDPNADNPLPQMLEGDSPSLGRHYAMIYSDNPGSYTQKMPATPDGRWFIDEMVSDQKLGTYTGKEVREKGLPVDYIKGYSPLKIYRMIPAAKMQSEWRDKYRMPDTPSK
ncbi:MAG TPA: beta-galactosidase [Capsulimonadaceae bacterium]|jgi:hypothetical protein